MKSLEVIFRHLAVSGSGKQNYRMMGSLLRSP